MKSLIIKANDVPQRLDKFMRKYFPHMSLGAIYKIIRKKKVKVNKKVAKIDYELKIDDCLDFYINDEFFESSKKNKKKSKTIRKPNLNIAYEDKNILICAKPSGLLSHSSNCYEPNLIDFIIEYLKQKDEYHPESENTFTPALCNRLDRNTSGLLICAKTRPALSFINSKIKSNEIEKYYKCLCYDNFKNKKGTIDTFLSKDEEKGQVYVRKGPENGAKRSVTQFEVLESKNGIALVRIRLLTGRTHQIRVHMNHIGCPIVGERKYNSLGNKIIHYKNQALCSDKIVFNFKECEEDFKNLNGLVISCETNELIL